MIDPKLLEIFSITVPIFALAGLGKILSLKNIINASNKQPLSWITYYLALPALIFSAFLKMDSLLFDPLVLLSLSLLPMATTILFIYLLLLLKRINFKTDKSAASIYLSYWGNNGYMGIPLAISAVGVSSGLPLAAVINGLSVPFYIMLSIVYMIKAKGPHDHNINLKSEFLHHTVFNPVIIAMIFGAFIAFTKPNLSSSITSNIYLTTVFSVLVAIFEQLGEMGLPLALILVGSNLNIKEINSDKFLLMISIMAKLIVAPASVFFLAKILFPSISKESFQVLILMNAVPGAVASFVISEKFDCAPDFVSSFLVLSTLLSIITIPLWLHVIL